jgi:hypothetical protein
VCNLTNLHLNIQNTNPPPLLHILNSLHTRAVKIAPELRILNEPVRFYELCEVFPRHEVVLATVLFSCARAAGRVRNAETEAVGVFGEEALEESRFSCARGAGDDDGAVVWGEEGVSWWFLGAVYRVLEVLYRWKTLWLCERSEQSCDCRSEHSKKKKRKRL